MSIYYPLALPTVPVDPPMRSLLIGAESQVAVSRSPFSYSEQVYCWPGQRWTAQIEVPRLTRADAGVWQAWIASLNGAEGTFLMGDPLATLRGAGGGTPAVSGQVTTATQSLPTKGWPNTTAILKAGDYLQIGTGLGARLHMVLEDVSSDGSGNATVSIWPAFRAPAASTTEKLTDGGFETWTSATNLTNWTENVSSYGSVNREASVIDAGTYAARIDVTTSTQFMDLSQTGKTLVPGTWVYAQGRQRADAAKTNGTRVILRNTTRSLDVDGSTGRWGATSSGNLISGNLTTSYATVSGWAYVPRTFASTDAYSFLIASNYLASGTSIYSDAFTLLSGATDGLPITTSSPKGVWRLAGNADPWQARLNFYEGFTLTCVEAFT